MDARGPGRFWLGCAVWAHPGWRGGFYPQGGARDALRLYGERLTAVEGNSFFYARPGREQLESWVERTPEGFHFCPKLPRALTHQRGELAGSEALVAAFLEDLEVLAPRLGPLLLQLPPGYGPERARDLAAFLDGWPRLAPALTVELRNRGWYTRGGARTAQELLGSRGVGRAVLDARVLYRTADDPQADHPRRKPDLPAHFMVTGQDVLLRLVAHPRTEPTAPMIEEWARRIHATLLHGHDVHAFVHCPDEDHSPRHALALQARLEELGAPVPPLPGGVEIGDGQLELF